jgi:transposase InsO family protein
MVSRDLPDRCSPRLWGLAQLSRTAWYRRSRAKDQTTLRPRIRELAHARPRFGYLRIWVLLRREGWLVNRNRTRSRPCGVWQSVLVLCRL